MYSKFATLIGLVAMSPGMNVFGGNPPRGQNTYDPNTGTVGLGVPLEGVQLTQAATNVANVKATFAWLGDEALAAKYGVNPATLTPVESESWERRKGCVAYALAAITNAVAGGMENAPLKNDNDGARKEEKLGAENPVHLTTEHEPAPPASPVFDAFAALLEKLSPDERARALALVK